MNTKINRLKSLRGASLIASFVASALAVSIESHAVTGASLTVQRDSGSTEPVVRSARRDYAQNETFIAGPNETLELLFADGSSITLAPGSSITVEQYRYDPAVRQGELSVRVNSGTVRVSGGVLNNTSAIQIRAASSNAAMDNGIAFVKVNDSEADLSLVLGKSLKITSGTHEQEITQAGNHVQVRSDGSLTDPAPLPTSEVQLLAHTVNPGLATGVVPTFTLETTTPETGLFVESTPVDSVAAKEEVLVGDEVTLGQIPSATCPGGNCGTLLSDLAILPPLGTPGVEGGLAGDSAGDWVYTASQDQTIFSANPDAVDYTSEGRARNTTNRTFGSRRFTQRLDPGCTDLLCAPRQGVSAGAEQGAELQFVVASLETFDSSFQFLDGDGVTSLDAGTRLYLVARTPDGHFPLGETPNPGNDTAFPFVATPFDNSSTHYIAAPYSLPVEALFDRINQPGIPGPAVEYSGDGGVSDQEESVRVLQAGFHLGSISWTGTVHDSDDDGNPELDSNGGIEVLNPSFSFPEGACRTDLQTCEASALQALMNRFRTDDFAQLLAGNLLQGETLTHTLEITNVLYTDPDSFLFIESTPNDPEATQQFVFATGSISGRSASAASIDRFFVSPGLEGMPDGGVGPDSTSFTPAGLRAFLRNETAAVLSLLDEGLFVFNPAFEANAQSAPVSRLMHVDFGYDSSAGRSAIGLTLGRLAYTEGGASVTAQSLGSTRASATSGSLSIHSGYKSTAFGGGNPNLTATGTGRAGYLVLENYDSNPAAGLTGGVEHAVGTAASEDARYAALRLATGATSIGAASFDATPVVGTRNGGATSGGFIAGIAERDSAEGGLALLSGGAPQSFTLTPDTDAGTISGSLALQVNGASTTLSFGGDAHESAFISDNRYAAFGAAQGDTHTAAVVSAGAVTAGLPSDLVPGEASYLKWGFFFGDYAVGDTTWHSHLTPWVAGNLSDEQSPLPIAASVTYSGSLIATVATNNSVYTVGGTYENQWNFASRTGTGRLAFDQGQYPLRTVLNANSNTRFTGAILPHTAGDVNAVPSNTPGIGSVAGSFVTGGVQGLPNHSAVAGSFSLSTTRNGTPYVATGVFGAEATAP